MWQWKSHGPGLSVCHSMSSVRSAQEYNKANSTYDITDSDTVIGRISDADRVALHGVDVVVLGASSATNDAEGVLGGRRQ